MAIRVCVPLMLEGACYSALFAVFLENVPCSGNFACSYMDRCVAHYVQELSRRLVELVFEYFVMVRRLLEFERVELFPNP